MDLLLVNLKLMGWIDNDLTALPEYVKFVARVTASRSTTAIPSSAATPSAPGPASTPRPSSKALAKELFQLAKSTNRLLTDDELHSCAKRWQERTVGSLQ
jgi:hypothetical protein